LTYMASLSDGNPLPSFLTWDATALTLSATTATGDKGVYDIKVTGDFIA